MLLSTLLLHLIVRSQCNDFEILNLRKTALIFGEQSYKNANPLNNPINDAMTIADSLRKIGFEVNVFTDADFQTMSLTINQWCSKLINFQVALFYYSGHGAEFNSENYLFPIDANPKTPNEMASQCISANDLLSRIDNSNVRYNILILDACRSNPFSRTWSRDFAAGGLAAMTGKGSFIGYAASPGKTASDGIGKNGPYTEAILKYITIPELTIDQLFTKVNRYVRDITSEGQIPFKNSSLSTDFCFSVKRTQQMATLHIASFMQPPSQALITEDQSFLVNIIDSGIEFKDAFSLNTLQTLKTLGGTPLKIVSKNRESIVAIDSATKKLFNIDVGKKAITAAIPLDYTPISIALNNAGTLAFVGFQGNNINGYYTIDLSKNIIKKITRLNGPPLSMILCDNNSLYILSVDSVMRFDINAEKAIGGVGGFEAGKCLGLSPNNKTLLVAGKVNQMDVILIFDAPTLKVKKTLELKSSLFAFAMDNIEAFVASGKEVFVIDLQKTSVTNRIAFQSEPKGIAISNDRIVNIWLPSENRFYVSKIDELAHPNSLDPEIKLKNFKESSKDDFKDERESEARLFHFFDTLNKEYHLTVEKIVDELGGAFHVTKQRGTVFFNGSDIIGFRYESKMFGGTYGIFAYNNKRSIDTHFIGKVIGNDFILEIHEWPETGNTPEVYKKPKNNLNWDDVRLFIRNYFLNRIEKLKE